MPSNPTDYFMDVIVVANTVAAVSGMIASVILLQRLKSRHRAQWEALGSPNAFGNSLAMSLGYQRYIFSSRYRDLNDSVIDRLAFAFKACMILVGGFLATALTFVVSHLLMYGPTPTHEKLTQNHPLNVYGAGLIAIIVIWNVANAWLWRYLRKVHPQTWSELGSPSFANLTFANSWNALRYLWSAEHRKLTDSTLSAAIYSIRLLAVLTVISLFVPGHLAAR
jgi:uncharacterized BrkB/YihY/UPF0761 family membrane protein